MVSNIQNICITLKHYLDSVGFQIDRDVAASGRFRSTVFGFEPGPDLSYMWSGMDVNSLGTYLGNFSYYSVNKYSYLGHTSEKKAMDEEATRIPNVVGQKAVTKKLINYLADNALIIPVFFDSGAMITAPYVHPIQASAGGFRWRSEEVWMENINCGNNYWKYDRKTKCFPH